MPKINLPRCGRCVAGDWPYARNKNGVERCDCPRGRALADADASRGRRRTDVPGVTAEQAMITVERLAVRMPMVPAGEFAHVELARELLDMVCDSEDLEWLVREAPRRYATWPGMREIRALYCAKFSPRDGVVVASTVYENGIIPGIVDPPHLIADSPRGGLISADAGDALMVRVLADAIPPERKPPRSATVKPPKPKLPTQEEIDRIKEEQRQNQERNKAGGEPPGDGA